MLAMIFKEILHLRDIRLCDMKLCYLNFRNFLFLSLFFALSCGKSSDVRSVPVRNFDVGKYLGLWYEIARIENRFEKGCENVTAHYSLRIDGGLNVVNRCFVKNNLKEANGRGYFLTDRSVGELKVSFFWPFYGRYNILYVDNDYQYAIIDGGSNDYLWILARKNKIDQKILIDLLKKIEEHGFETKELIYTKQYA